ncbi:MAG: hypothetical protein H5T98_00965 [Syntrophomonadaceae bacterium]|nr:hypothetical protein [Syntrophomonadaceae bacterium]
MSVTETHDLKDTLTVEVETPGHEKRGAASALFKQSKKAIFTNAPVLALHPVPGRCFICNATEEELGEPLEAHHFGIEWSFANAPIDWERVKTDFPDFAWDKFDPTKPMDFVDDMRVQGLLLCKKHHTGKDEGIHNLPFSLWLAQKYLKDGYKFSDLEVIHHDDE